MTPEQYCYNKVAPRGSALYFSLRRLPIAKKNAIAAICAFYSEIEDIVLTYEDLNTARIKLNWWRDQIIKMNESLPDHPVAVFLKTCSQRNTIPFTQLIEIIEGLEQSLISPQFNNFEDVMIHIMRTAGVRELLIANVLQENNLIEKEIIYQFAFVIEYTHYLQQLHRYVRNDIFYFSQDEMQPLHVTEAQLHEYVTTNNIHDLLKLQSEKIERAYQNILKLPNVILSALSNTFARCKMNYAVLQAIKSEEFKVLEKFVDITPLKKWWLSL